MSQLCQSSNKSNRSSSNYRRSRRAFLKSSEAEHEALFGSIRNSQPINDSLHAAHSTMLGILGRMATYTACGQLTRL